MSCWHYYAPQEPNETAFSIDASRIVFGRGALAEAGRPRLLANSSREAGEPELASLFRGALRYW